MRSPKLVKAIDAVTATTTSAAIDVSMAEKVTLMFKRADHTSGSTSFAVTGSIDGGTTYVTLNSMIDDVTNTNAQTRTRVAAVSLASNTSKLYALDLESFGYTHIKITATETTDGTHTAYALVEYCD